MVENFKVSRRVSVSRRQSRSLLPRLKTPSDYGIGEIGFRTWWLEYQYELSKLFIVSTANFIVLGLHSQRQNRDTVQHQSTSYANYTIYIYRWKGFTNCFCFTVDLVRLQPQECLETRKQVSHSSAHRQPRLLLKLEAFLARLQIRQRVVYLALQQLLHQSHRLGGYLGQALRPRNPQRAGYLGQALRYRNLRLAAYLGELQPHNHRLGALDLLLKLVVVSLATRIPLKLPQAVACSQILGVGQSKILVRDCSGVLLLSLLKVAVSLDFRITRNHCKISTQIYILS